MGDSLALGKPFNSTLCLKITGSISFCMKMKSIPKYFMIEIVTHDGEESHKGISVRW